MRFFHISDLHFGKQLYGYDLTEEHRNFIRQLGKYCEEYLPDAVLIAGDIYDRAVPSDKTSDYQPNKIKFYVFILIIIA